MAAEPPFRLLLETPATSDLVGAYRAKQLDALTARINALIGWQGPYQILELPSFEFKFSFGPGFETQSIPEGLVDPIPDRLVYGLAFDDLSEAEAFALQANRSKDVRAGSDATVMSLDSWCPGESNPPIFHTRTRANILINANALLPADGFGVNVVMVDEGFSAVRLLGLFPNVALIAGWPIPNRPGAGQAPPDSHGTMVARNVLSLAPRVRVFDVPLLPTHPINVGQHVVWAAAYLQLFATLLRLGILAIAYPGPWVVCNAWGVYDRRSDLINPRYSDNSLNPYNIAVRDLDDLGVDQVFGAGNCGQFCPSTRCGPNDRGYGRSILGSNSHPRVLTVGAVRADGIWSGYSSQGPGQAGFLPEIVPGTAPMVVDNMQVVPKPDLCAPSDFVEPDDAFISSGTSAACGVAVGAIAALRSNAAFAGLSTEALRARLRNRARRPVGAGWDHRLGYGILDLH